MRQVLVEPPSPAELESGEGKFVDDDGGEPGLRDRQRVTMEQRHAEQRQRKQDEIDGYSKQKYGFDHNSLDC